MLGLVTLQPLASARGQVLNISQHFGSLASPPQAPPDFPLASGLCKMKMLSIRVSFLFFVHNR